MRDDQFEVLTNAEKAETNQRSSDGSSRNDPGQLNVSQTFLHRCWWLRQVVEALVISHKREEGFISVSPKTYGHERIRKKFK
jgi:hypothetical protein